MREGTTTVLLVGEELGPTHGLTARLKALGYETICATVENADTLLDSARVSVVLLEVKHSVEKRSQRLAARIQRCGPIPLILITSAEENDAIAAMLDLTPYQILFAPVPDRELAAAVELALRHASARTPVTWRELSDSVTAGQAWILDTLDEHIVYEDCSMRVLWANRAACDSVGLTRDEVIGEHCYRLWADASSPCPDCPVLAAMDSHQPEGTVKTTPDDRFWQIHGYPVIDESGTVHGGVEITLEITDLIRTEEALRQRESTLNIILDSIGDGVIAADMDGRVIRLNPVAEGLCGWTAEEATGRLLSEVFHVTEASSGAVVDDLVVRIAAADGIVTLGKDLILHSQEGTEYQIADSGAPMRDASDAFVGVVIVFRDMTEEYELHQQLLRGEEKYRTIVSSMSDMIFLFDAEDHFIGVYCPNDAPLYADPDDFIGRHSSDVLPPPVHEKYVEGARKLRKIGTTQRYEYSLEIEGQEQWYLATLDLHADGETVIASVRDVSERKHAQRLLAAQLKEKEVLLKEIHHRVKNNLQIISSLLRLQCRNVSDESTLATLEESQHRIRSMALLHDQLYRSVDLANIDIRSYIRQLVNGLLHSYRYGSSRVVVERTIDDVALGLNYAIPVGLIINELVSNALKYAFPDGGGTITVSLRVRGEHRFELRVEDDGVALPPDLDWRHTKSLGLQLVITLAEGQLSGSVELEQEGGTSFIIQFAIE